MNRFQSGNNSKRKYTLALLPLVVACALFFTPSTSKADSINDQLTAMFTTMSNTTRPGDYHSVTRDGYTGGGFTLRSQLRTLTPINISLPSAAGGCGGIDLFGGSFSFINADEFVQMLRNIAANAAGLAFQLALNAMDAVLDNAISKLQAVIQKMNDLTANSCQLAKGLLVDTAGAFGSSAKTSVASQLSSDGIAEQFESFWGGENGSKDPVAAKSEKSTREPCKDYGNLMWCLLNSGDFSSEFLGSEDVQKEFVMSLTGTWIIGKDISTDSTGALIGGNAHDVAPLSSDDALDVLINGKDKYQIYKCDDKETCTNPSTQEISIDGLANTITKFFNDDGYLQAIHDGTALTEDQLSKALFYNANGASSSAATLARRDVTLAKNYIREIAPIVAYVAANQYISQMLSAAATGARIELDNSNPASAYYEKTLKRIADAQARLQSSFQVAASTYGGPSRVLELKLSYLQSLPPQAFAKDLGPLSGQ